MKKLKRLYHKLVFYRASYCPFFKPIFRALFYKHGGVRMKNYKRTFIGYGVYIDDISPSSVYIGEYTFLTQGVSILTHYVSTKYSQHIQFYYGNVSIGDYVFIGMNTVIVKPVSIGNGAIIGANSVIVCDIPALEVWGGNPAKFLRKRTLDN